MVRSRTPEFGRHTLSIWIGILVPLFVVVGGIFFVSRPVTAAGPTLVGGTIDVPTTWYAADSPYIVTDTVSVVASGVLTVEAGVEVRFDAGTGLRVGSGPLLAQGSLTQPITFTANVTSPARGFWTGLLFEGTAVPSVLQNCLVEYAATGLAVAGDTDNHRVEACTFRHNGDGGGWSTGGAIDSAGDALLVVDSLIYDNEVGLHLHKSFGDTIQGNQIYDNDGFGLAFVASNAPGGDDNQVLDNQIYGNGGFGLGFLGQVPTYSGGDDNLIAGNEIYGNVAGGGYGGVGLYLDYGARNAVSGNRIEGNASHGIWAGLQADLTLSGNVVRANGGAGLVYADPNALPADLGGNVLCNNTTFELESAWPRPLPAQGNWFGTNTPASGVEVTGNVVFTPWISMALQAQPAVLPADGWSTAAVTLTMRGGGHAVPDGYSVTLTPTQGSLAPSTLALFDGRGTATYVAGTVPGAVDVDARDGCATLTLLDVLTLETFLDLAVSKTGAFVVGANKEVTVSYTISLSNTGLLTATGVVLTDFLPTGTTYPGGAWSCAGGLCNYAAGDLAPSTVLQISLPLQLDGGGFACPQVLTNVVRVGGNPGDVHPTNDVYTLTSLFECLPDLVVTLHDGVGPDATTLPPRPCVSPGEVVTYSIAYSNTGPAPASQVVLTAMVPLYSSYAGTGWICAGQTCTRDLGSLAPGDGGTAELVVLADAVLPVPRLVGEARIGGAEDDLYPPDNVAVEYAPVCGMGAYRLYLPLIFRQHVPPPPPPPTRPPPTPTPEPPAVSDVEVNPETGLVYVASPLYDAVLVVDPAGVGAVTATVPVGDHPLGLAVVTTTNKIYAANLHGWTLTAIRGSDHTPLTDIYVGAQACKVAADSGDGLVYVTNHLESDNGVAAVDSRTDTRLYYYSRLHAAAGRYGIDVDPANERLFIAARDGGLIAIQDALAPNQEPQLFKLSPARVPFVVAFNPATEHLFVTAPHDNLVVVLEPYSIEWARGEWVWYRGYPVFVLDKDNAGWIAEVPVGLGAEEGIALNPRTGYVYVTNAGSNTLSVLLDDADPAGIHWVMDVAVGDYPQGVAVDVATNTIYVGNAGSRDVTVVDGATHTVVKTIPLE
ncbi:MAG: right-handed parallel beta-helix repeat-containing protein [Anaerolineae bacterium]|jgi:uncharacterized repeat protein (TIGR01451 family)